MAPIKTTRKSRATGNAAVSSSGNNIDTTDNIQTISGHSTQEGRVNKRVVKNKAKDNAAQGAEKWTEQERQTLLGSRAIHKHWKQTSEILGRTDQSVRSEFKKMKDGERNKAGGVDWQQKALDCDQKRVANPPAPQAGPGSTPTTLGSSTLSAASTVPVNTPSVQAGPSNITPTSGESSTSANSAARTPESGTLSAFSPLPVDSPIEPAKQRMLEPSSHTMSLADSNLRGDSNPDTGRQSMTTPLQQDEEDDIAYMLTYRCFVAPPERRQLKPTEFHPTDHWVHGRTIEEEPERKTRPSNYFFQKEGYHQDEDGTWWYDHPYGFSRPCPLEAGPDRKEHFKLRPLQAAERDADLLLFFAASG
ncbi:hypothetical protein D6D01_04901 [Aureobasidium pullulans]|uniref:Myb-like domain-containing protein n=1 Tax=Aureobasidium pullulans TaxID=5580 RepID=A0A4S9L959_AURPU|nr:hypothetical protein D6D01_04901 [Aureobasidium pullulans]